MATLALSRVEVLRRSLRIVALTVVLIATSLLTEAQRSYGTYFDTRAEFQLVQLINQARARQGLQPLAVDRRLTDAARRHSELMVQRRSLSHQLAGESPLQDRVAAESLPSDRLAENIAVNQDAISAHQALMHSPPHLRNILDPSYDTIGVGVVRQGENIYVTEDFARRLPEMSEPQAESAVQTAIARYARAHHLAAPRRKPQTQLRQFACDMARNDSVRTLSASALPGSRAVFTWTANDPAMLPNGIGRMLSSEGYSLGACFAPSVSHPGGVYWLVMVGY